MPGREVQDAGQHHHGRKTSHYRKRWSQVSHQALHPSLCLWACMILIRDSGLWTTLIYSSFVLLISWHSCIVLTGQLRQFLLRAALDEKRIVHLRFSSISRTACSKGMTSSPEALAAS